MKNQTIAQKLKSLPMGAFVIVPRSHRPYWYEQSKRTGLHIVTQKVGKDGKVKIIRAKRGSPICKAVRSRLRKA